jgi:hypothetical protein
MYFIRGLSFKSSSAVHINFRVRVRVVGPTLKASRRLVWTHGKNGNTGFLSSYALKLESERSVDSPGTRSWYVCRVWYDDASESIYKLIKVGGDQCVI